MFSDLSKSQIITLSVVALFVIAEVVLFATGILKIEKPEPRTVENTDDSESVEPMDTGGDFTKKVPEISKDVNVNATRTKAKVEVNIENEQGEDSGSKVGVYNVVATDEGFDPAGLVINKGDVLEIEFSSPDNIDFHIPAYGIYLTDKEGQRKVSFNASASGTYRIQCRDACPPSGPIYGQLLVKLKE